jgi:hypothetical protein
MIAKLLLILAFIITFQLNLFPQENKVVAESSLDRDLHIYSDCGCVTHEKADFLGDSIEGAFFKLLRQRIDSVVQIIKVKNVFVAVILQFDIDKKGRLTNIDFIQSSGNAIFDNKLSSILSSSPFNKNWNPAKAYGNAINSKFTVYIAIYDNHKFVIRT